LKIKIRAALVFPQIDLHMARTLIKALEPDNVNVPSSITINNIAEEGMFKIIVEFIGNPEEILTLRNTIDDLLEHLNVALKVIESVKDN